MTKSENEGGFVSHLTELRKRLIHSFIFLFIFFIGCYFFSEHLYGFLVEPFAKAENESGTDRRLIFKYYLFQMKFFYIFQKVTDL